MTPPAPHVPPAPDRTPIVLVAHGSRDPRAARSTEALARAVRAAAPDTTVRSSYLDHAGPRPAAVLRSLEAAGYDQATLVPLLLTAAYHRRVDVPAQVRAAREAGLRIPVGVADVLGPAAGSVDQLLVTALVRRLTEVGCGPGGAHGLVLVAAGTRDAQARVTVDRVAAALGAVSDVPCVAAYASAAAPTAGEAVHRLRAGGADRVAVAAYFLAPGRLYDLAMDSARSAGAIAVSAPLGAAGELVRLVLDRAARACPPAELVSAAVG